MKLNILNKIEIDKVFFDINNSFKNMHFAIKLLKKRSSNYQDWINISKFKSGKSFYILYKLLSGFEKNIDNYFIENLVSILKKKYLFSDKKVDLYVKYIYNNIKKKFGEIIISQIFINKSNLFRKILVRRGRATFSYNKKNFLNLYIILKYKENKENKKQIDKKDFVNTAKSDNKKILDKKNKEKQ
jgi:hypothetical protein